MLEPKSWGTQSSRLDTTVSECCLPLHAAYSGADVVGGGAILLELLLTITVLLVVNVDR